jgi:hypothetical protein
MKSSGDSGLRPGQTHASMRRNGGKRPGRFDAAYLSQRCRDEFGMMAPPQPVQRIPFPVIAGVGRALGWDRRTNARLVPNDFRFAWKAALGGHRPASDWRRQRKS